MDKDLAVVIVSWNVREMLLQNLELLVGKGGASVAPSFEVTVVDNASTDGTAEAVRAAFPSVRVIANETNNGFAKACNQGIAASDSRHVLLLNPDMRVEPDALEKTVAYLDGHPDVGVMGARLMTADGKPIHHMRRFPTVKDQLAIILKLPHLFPKLIHRYHAKDLPTHLEQEVDSVRGSYFAMSRTALDKIGLLDERFFIWFEEVDYCKRAKQAGLKVMYVPSVRATDLVGRSFVQKGMYWKQKMFTRSMIRYFEKWHPSWEVWMLYAAQPAGLGVALFADLWHALFPTARKNA